VQDISAKNKISQFLNDYGHIIILLLTFIIGSNGFFDRQPSYHDEIINTGKADIGLIFDYALRPLFYSLNIVWYELFGHHPRSIAFGSLLAYCLCSSCLYYIGKICYGPIAGIACSLSFLGMLIPFVHGIKAIPNLISGSLVLVSVAFFFSSFVKNKTLLYNKNISISAFFAGVFAILALSAHPTAVSYVVSFGSLLVIVLLINHFSKKDFLIEKMPSSGTCISTLAGLFISFLILCVLYHYFYGTNYLSAFFQVTDRVNVSEKYLKYHQKWYYYFELALEQQMLLLISICVNLTISALLFYYFASSFRTKPSAIPIVIVGYFLFCSLGLLSCSGWKFDRALNVVIGLLSLLSGLSFGLLLSFIISIKRPRLASLFSIFIVLFSLYGVIPTYKAGVKITTDSAQYHHKYLSLSHAISLTKTRNIGYIGKKKYTMHSMNNFIIISDKQLVEFETADDYLNITNPTEHLKKRLVQSKTNYILLNTKSGNASADSMELLKKTFKELNGHLVYNWRELAELWRFDNLQQ